MISRTLDCYAIWIVCCLFCFIYAWPNPMCVTVNDGGNFLEMPIFLEQTYYAIP
jgi:hypothetical protein